MGDFNWPFKQSALRGSKANVLEFFIGASATKKKSKLYGLPQDILINEQKTTALHPYILGLNCARF